MDLFSKLRAGSLDLAHRVVMAPLTRMRALQPGSDPGELAALYYGQRASHGGLIITEASQVSRQGQGYPSTPGIHSAAQIAGWKHVTDAVHAKGGSIFLQLWHVGRISHRSHQPAGELPVAPSAVRPRGMALTALWEQVPYETPRALETTEIAGVVDQFRDGARSARMAGFDGVELHSANGYLLDQFLRDGTNRRTDEYGGSIENRARLLFEIAEAASEVFGPDRVGVRLSPLGTFNDMSDSDPVALFSHIVRGLAARHLAYVHIIEARGDEAGEKPAWALTGPASTAALFRPLFPGALIGAGGFTPDLAAQAIEAGIVDAVAFGRLFISNPDLPRRLELGARLNPYDRSTFYGGGAKGYTDYPALTTERELEAARSGLAFSRASERDSRIV